MVTQDTLGALIPMLTKKREKKNYQEILMEYLNYLGTSENKLNAISKEMKSNFFQNINEEELNTHDDLKFLILMREEIFKYKIKKYYFNKYKNKALYNRDLIDEDNPFINNNILDYQQFKKIKSNIINKDSINLNNYLNNNMNDKNKKIDINDIFKSSSKKSIHTNENSSRNENMNYNDLLYRSSKKSINLQDSINVLDIQKNINEALNNTNDLFNKIRLHNSGFINYNNQFQNINDINNIDGNNNENKFIKAKSNLLPNYKNNLININNDNKNDNINNIYKIDNTKKHFQINTNNNLDKKNTINEDLYDSKDSLNNNLIENNEEIKHFYNITNLEKYKNIFNNLKNRENVNKNNNEKIKIYEIGKTNKIEENLDKYNNEESNKIFNKGNMDNYINTDKIDNDIYNIPNKDSDDYNNIKNSNLEDYQNNIITNDNNKKSMKNEENEYKNKNYLDNYPNNFYNNIIIKNNDNNFEIDTTNNNNEKIVYKNIKNYNENNIDNYQTISNNNINNKKKDSIHKYNSYKTNIKNNRKIYNNINKSNTENKSNVFSLRSRKNNLDTNKEKKNNSKINNYNSNKPKKSLNNNKNKNKSFDKLDNNKKDSISIKNKINKINKNKSTNKIEKKKKSNNPKPNQNNKNVIKQEQKQFDLKNLFRLPVKDKNIDEDDKQKYNNSKYLSRKYRNYLNTEENLGKSKKKYLQKSPKKNNINTNLYNNSLFDEKDKDIMVSLNTDNSLINKINNNNPKNMNINKIQIVKNNNLINNRDLSADRIREIDKSIESISNNNYNTNDLLNNGFFAGKSIKKNNNDNKSNYSQKTDNNRYDLLNQKIEIMLQKNNEFKELLKMKNINIDNKNKNNLNDNYDYIKKCKGIAADIYGLNNNENNLNINNYYIKTNYDDQEYDSIFHPKNNNKTNYLNTIENTKSNTSINNLLENLDNKKGIKNMIDYENYYDYDDLINNISDNQKTKPRKTINKSISIKSKKDYLTPNNNNIDENQNSYVLAPMAKIPVTNISFRARLKYYSNKKEKELKKMKQKLIEEEKQIYTFHPKTGENKLNVIKYNNYKNNLNLTQDFENNNKRKVDLNRIENLYLDYKDKINKREELAREYYKEAGISFSPILKDNNKEMIRYKKKVAQMPYLDRIEFYNGNYEFNRNKNQYLAEEK